MTAFLCDDIWKRIKEILAKSRQPAYVAVAYFGQGAAKLLPLPKGSRLVVDASQKAVKSGQTHPKDLITMRKRGVRVYSVANCTSSGKAAVLGGVC